MTLTKAQQVLGGSAALLGAAAFAATLSLVPAYAQTPPFEPVSTIRQTAPNAAAPGGRLRLVDLFARRLAAKLGVPREQVEKALRELRTEVRQQRLGRGQPGQPGRSGQQGRPRMAGRAGTEVVEIVAKVTGLAKDEITGQLREGKSLTEIAAPKGKTHADLKAAILADAKPKLDAQITAGRVTRGQADRADRGKEQRLDHLLTAKRPAPAHRPA